MKRIGWLTLILLTALIPENILAGDLAFSKIEARGTGCPLGSTDIITSPDQKSVSLLFNEMIIELPQFDGENDNEADIPGQNRGNRFDRNLVQKICNILIEADVPADHKVDSIDVKIDLRGSTLMDEGTTAFFHSQLINLQGPGRSNEARRDFIARKIWREGPIEDDWTVSSTKNIQVKGNCSRHGDSKNTFNLRNLIRADIRPLGERLNSMVFIGLDSADILGKMEFKVHTSSCRGRQDRPTRPTRPVIVPTRPTRPVTPVRPGIGAENCPRGLIFHEPARRCLTKREVALWGRR